jgi:addiction module RelE/StbE family toxin
MRIEWSQQSLDEIEAIGRYVEENNPAAADRIKRRIVAALGRLESRPLIGRMGRIANTREFVFTDIPYIGIYEVDESRGSVTIIRVVHTSRFYPPKSDE